MKKYVLNIGINIVCFLAGIMITAHLYNSKIKYEKELCDMKTLVALEQCIEDIVQLKPGAEYQGTPEEVYFDKLLDAYGDRVVYSRGHSIWEEIYVIENLRNSVLEQKHLDQLNEIHEALEIYCREFNNYLYPSEWEKWIEQPHREWNIAALRQYIKPDGFDKDYTRLEKIFSSVSIVKE